MTLDAYRSRPVLIAFSDPDCAPCDPLAAELERLHRASSDLQILMISRDDPADTPSAATDGVSFPVALQRGWEVSRRYGPIAAPVAYVVDGQGLLATKPAMGVEAIVDLGRSWSNAAPVEVVR